MNSVALRADGKLVARLLLGELEAGDVLVGIVSDVWLYHGAQVDVMCEYDG